MTYELYSQYNYEYLHPNGSDDLILFWFIGGLIFVAILLLINALVSERRLDRLERIQDSLLLENRIKEV